MIQQLRKFWQDLFSDFGNSSEEKSLLKRYSCSSSNSGESVLEAGEWVADTSTAVLTLATALGVINPTVSFAVAFLAFVGPIKKVIEIYAAKNEYQALTLEEVVATAAPLAYLRSFNALIKCNDRLAEINWQQQSQDPQAAQNLEQFTLNQELAINALGCFHRSELAGALNQVLSAQLQQAGMSQREAQIITNWVAWKTEYYLKDALKGFKNRSGFESLKVYITEQESDSNPYQSIEIYLKEHIASKPKEKVFNEDFSFEEIYVPLNVHSVDTNGEVINWKGTFSIEGWVKGILQDSNQRQQVMFIQGGPGRGKTVFCRLFADRIRQHFYPLWIPIFIRLRDIDAFEPSFEKTLQKAVGGNFARVDNWLTNRNLKFLFFLDGFDELRMEGRVSGGIERFIQQVGSF